MIDLPISLAHSLQSVAISIRQLSSRDHLKLMRHQVMFRDVDLGKE
jgi:hypothetical protein